MTAVNATAHWTLTVATTAVTTARRNTAGIDPAAVPYQATIHLSPTVVYLNPNLAAVHLRPSTGTYLKPKVTLYLATVHLGPPTAAHLKPKATLYLATVFLCLSTAAYFKPPVTLFPPTVAYFKSQATLFPTVVYFNT